MVALEVEVMMGSLHWYLCCSGWFVSTLSVTSCHLAGCCLQMENVFSTSAANKIRQPYDRMITWLIEGTAEQNLDINLENEPSEEVVDLGLAN